MNEKNFRLGVIIILASMTALLAYHVFHNQSDIGRYMLSPNAPAIIDTKTGTVLDLSDKTYHFFTE